MKGVPRSSLLCWVYVMCSSFLSPPLQYSWRNSLTSTFLKEIKLIFTTKTSVKSNLLLIYRNDMNFQLIFLQSCLISRNVFQVREFLKILKQKFREINFLSKNMLLSAFFSQNFFQLYLRTEQYSVKKWKIYSHDISPEK